MEFGRLTITNTPAAQGVGNVNGGNTDENTSSASVRLTSGDGQSSNLGTITNEYSGVQDSVIKGLKSEITDKEEEIADKQKELQNANNDVTKINNNITSLNAQEPKQENFQDADKFNKKHAEWQKKVDAEQAKLKVAQEKAQKLDAEIKNLEQEKQQLQTRIDEMETQGDTSVGTPTEPTQPEQPEQPEIKTVQDAKDKGYDTQDFDVNEDETVKELNRRHDEIADKMSEAAAKGDTETYQKLNDELYTLNNDIDAAIKTAKEKHGIGDNTITSADSVSTIQSKIEVQDAAKADQANRRDETTNGEDQRRTNDEINADIERLESECPGNVSEKFEGIKTKVKNGKITTAEAQAEMKKIVEQTTKWKNDYVKLDKELDERQKTLDQKRDKLLSGTNMTDEDKANGWAEYSRESNEIAQQRKKLNELSAQVQ